MTAFEYITVAFSFVLGFGITRQLAASVSVFRARDHFELHWVPLVWAGAVFVTQIQFWWALFELSSIFDAWTLAQYLSLLGLALLLFVAGALILPLSVEPGQATLLDDFDKNGRWALIFLCGFHLLANWANWHFWDTSPNSPTGYISAGLLASIVIFLVSKNQALRAILTVAYFAQTVNALVVFSPSAYQ